MTDPSATTPTSIGAITDDWLNAALHASGALPHGSEASITARTPLGDGAGWMCEVARLDLAITGPAGDTPSRLVVKVPSSDPNVVAMLGPMRLWERESLFYLHAAPLIGDLAPACPLVIERTESGEHLVAIEYLDGGRFGDQLAGADAGDAELAIRALARLHARFWESPELDSYEWLPAIDWYGNQAGADLYRVSIDAFRTRFGHLIQPANEPVVQHIADHVPQLLARLASGPQTLSHFDARLDNMYFATGPDRVRLFDFQTVVRGGVGYDLGYFLSHNLPVDVRRASERSLIGSFVDELAANGVTYSAADAFAAYRLGALYAWITPVFVTSNLDMTNDRAVAMWTAVIERSQAALLDLNVAELLG